MQLEKVISGGQTGVDRAALDAALRVGFPIGGWCPKGRRSEDGFIPHVYPMTETPSTDYPDRTRCNVRDSSATLVVKRGELDGGSKFTTKVARELDRPCQVVDIDDPDSVEVAWGFILANRTKVLNVAGPRESKQPGIYAIALEFLTVVLGQGKAKV